MRLPLRICGAYLVSLLLAVGILFGCCSGAVAEEPQVVLSGTLVIEGSGDSRDLLSAIAERFEALHPGTDIEFPDDIGTRSGLRAASEGRIELARVSGTLSVTNSTEGLTYRVFAYSPVVVVIHPDIRNIDGLRAEQVVAIYSGELVNWKQLGGTAHRIYPVSREEDNTSRIALEKQLKGFGDIASPVSKMYYTTSDVVDAIARHKGAIGYAPIAAVRKKGLKVMSLDGVYPSAENMRKGNYGMIVPLGIAHGSTLRPVAKAFVDFLYSNEARRIVREHGCLPTEKGAKP